MAILGVFVSLATGDSDNAGTDDQIYLGVWGNRGGREFPLKSRRSPPASGRAAHLCSYLELILDLIHRMMRGNFLMR